jgi:hypothetical protein
MEVLNIDYSNDFKGNLDQNDDYFWLSYIMMRLETLFWTFIDLGLLYLGIKAISDVLNKVIFFFG